MKIYTPIKAMRVKCLDCCNGSTQEVRLCPCTDCALWPYRLGHRPKKAPTGMVDDLEFRDEEIIDEDDGVCKSQATSAVSDKEDNVEVFR